MPRYHKNPYAEYRIEAGILFLYYKPQSCLSLQIAKKVVQDRLRFQMNTSYPVYCDVRELIDSTKEARDYLIQEGSASTLAIAFHVTRGLTESMVRFYLKRRETHIETRLFYEMEPALEFLKTYRDPKHPRKN